MPIPKQVEYDLAEIEEAARKNMADKLYQEHNFGFQLLDSEGDDKAVGVRAFRVGDIWFFAPIFLLNGEVKGQKLLYLKDQDLMVPFDENWVDYLLAQRPTRLGQPENMPSTITEPNLKPFIEPPLTSSLSVGTVKAAMVETFSKIAAPEISVKLEDALKAADPAAKLGLMQMMMKDLKVADALLVRHPNLMILLRPSEQEEAKIAETVEAERVQVIENPQDAATSDEELSVAQKGYAIRDTRAEDEKLKVIPLETAGIVAPSRTGFFQLLTAKGPRDALFIQTSATKPADGSRINTIIDWETKAYVPLSYPTTDVAISDTSSAEATQRWHEMYADLPDSEELKAGDSVIFIGPDEGQVSPAHMIRDVIKHDDLTELVGYSRVLLLSDIAGGDAAAYDNKMVIPASWKPVKISQERSDIIPKALTEAMLDAGDRLKVAKIGSGSLRLFENETPVGDSLSRFQALWHLVKERGLGIKQAEEMIDAAFRHESGTWLLKRAQPPAGLEQEAPMLLPMPREAPADEMQGENPYAAQSLEVAQKALEAGKQDVLDVAGVSALLGSSEDMSFIKAYLGDLLTAEDRIGRILSTLFWNYDKLVETYGRADIQQLEEKLTQIFESLGELILDLKKKVALPEGLSYL